MQLQTATINFDPNYTFDWNDRSVRSNLKDWPSFHIPCDDGRTLIFNLKEGTAFEQQKAGEPFNPLMVHTNKYDPAIIKSTDEMCFEDEDGNLDCDPTLLRDWGQQGRLIFTRLHWVNGVPTAAKVNQMMSGGSIWLKGDSFYLYEDTWANGAPMRHDGTPVEVLNSNCTHYPKTQENYFTGEIEAVQIPGDFQVTEERLIRSWEHSKVGTIKVYQYETFDGQKMTRAVLTDKKGHQFHLYNTTDNPEELTCANKGQLNWRTGEWIVARGLRKTAPDWKTRSPGQPVIDKHWSRRRQWTRKMRRMAA